MNSVVETYSRLATAYDEPRNIDSCWGRFTQDSFGMVAVAPRHGTVAEVGCGTGRELSRLAGMTAPDVQLIGIEPAANMCRRAAARTTPYPNVRIVGGRFEELPLRSSSIDYLYSILAFHWTTDVDASV